MEINFNVLRRKLIDEYNSVIKKLNYSICEDVDMNRVIIPVEDLRRNMDNLRNFLITIGCLEEKNNSDCQCILSDKDTINLFALEE